MNLFRVHAFAVVPSRTAKEEKKKVKSLGGEVKITVSLKQAINANIKAAKFENKARVDFQVDQKMRTNAVRDAVVSYGFGRRTRAHKAAMELAEKLSRAMDLRSDPKLFLLTAMREGDVRRVNLWTFPRDEAFQLSFAPGGPTLYILKDVFSQTSDLRKAADFQGKNFFNSFLSGRALDFQSKNASLAIADFWIKDFLMCTFGMSGDSGTRLLADMLRDAIDVVDDPVAKDQLFTAVLALQHLPQDRWSLDEVAEKYLSGGVREEFLDSIPNEETGTATFDLNRNVLQSRLRFRIFRLDTGVYVSSPVDEIGKSLAISGDGRRTLSVSGTIIAEKMRARHG